MFTGALYNLTRTNQSVADGPFYSTLVNTETNGGELALTGKVTEEWETSIGYSNQRPFVTSSGRNDAIINEAVIARRTPALVVPDNGRVVPFVPFNMFNAWNKYDVSSLMNQNKGTFALAAGVIYNTQQYAELNNAVIVPGYVRVDGAAFFKISENISGQVNIENILGANYYVSAHNNNNITPGSPRAAYVTMNAKF
jgi:catecholate siderophore receptor